MSTIADNMNAKLAALYPDSDNLPDFTADRYMLWVEDHGPAWEDILTYVENETGLTGMEAWEAYWADIA